MFIPCNDMPFVSKEWGYELWMANNERYCGKILFMKQGRCCSLHYHEQKDEVLYVKFGRIQMLHYNPFTDKGYKINWNEVSTGSAFHIERNRVHQMIALEDTEIIETSTQHFDEDSFRLTRQPSACWSREEIMSKMAELKREYSNRSRDLRIFSEIEELAPKPLPEKIQVKHEEPIQERIYMNGDAILQLSNGKFKVMVNIQDGTEHCGEYDTEAKARQAWVENVKAYNHVDRDPSEVPVYAAKPQYYFLVK